MSSIKKWLRGGRDVDMTHGPLFGKIVMFSLPLMLSGILQLLYNAADVIVVGQFSADRQTALAAVGSTGALTNLIVNLFMGLSVGACVAISHALGSGREDEVHKLVHTSILTSLLGGVAVFAFGFSMARVLLALMDTPDNVINASVLYMRIIFCGMPAQMLYNYGAAILRAKGDTKRPLYFLAISGAFNVLLNLFFVIVLSLDVAGVALATIAAQYLSAGMVLFHLIHLKDCCRLDLRRLHIDRHSFVRILCIGLPAGVQGMVFSISNVLIQSSINSFGKAAMAGNTAGSNLDGFIYIAMNAFHHTALTFTGQNFGAGKPERIKKVAWMTVASVTTVGVVIGFTVFFFGHPLLSIYAPGDEEAISYGMIRLTYLATTYFLCGIMDVGSGLLRGLGHSTVSTIISLTGACGLRVVWIYTIFRQMRSIEVLFLSYPVSWLLTAAVDLLLFAILLTKWKKRLTVAL